MHCCLSFIRYCTHIFLLRDILSISVFLVTINNCVRALRTAADLEPLQPLLKKFIGCLEADALPLIMETSAPRTPLDRMSLWIGIKSL